jgi:hypothetical protein
MILHEKILKNPLKILELINEFSTIMGYKFSIQKLVVLLYSWNEQSENEIKKKCIIYNSIKGIKILVIRKRNVKCTWKPTKYYWKKLKMI